MGRPCRITEDKNMLEIRTKWLLMTKFPQLKKRKDGNSKSIISRILNIINSENEVLK